ncbi:hypothetical protein RFI_36580 [Reticulomyxa filosa]|uniref:Uncharacterized protein n=1 Tax=Reticulomyxa filosa TaxID=46433 RepID=X6LJJ1_RETFI|nr:hypothetical protein RFI_36580 [Reticulomyxa filosa]|eukprot:ETO00860.1 hypothetical protein RFI_36580 [Reticulomyxa filosa]
MFFFLDIFLRGHIMVVSTKFNFLGYLDKDVVEAVGSKLKKVDEDYYRIVENTLHVIRVEEDPHKVNEINVRSDSEILKDELLTDSKRDQSITNIIDLFSKRSWGHIDQVLVEFNKVSKRNANAVIEKIFLLLCLFIKYTYKNKSKQISPPNEKKTAQEINERFMNER